MAKPTTIFICQGCGTQSPKWLGRCPGCGEWNSLVEERLPESRSAGSTSAAAKAIPLSEIHPDQSARLRSGMTEVDRVLGGGLFPGGAVLLGGDPGVGKTTLLLQVCGMIGRDRPVLYASGEESLEQIASRALRLGVEADGLQLMAETAVESVLEEVERLSAGVLVVDSIQTASTQGLTSVPGSLSQVRESSVRYIEAAKRRAMPVFLVGHITKDGMIAGPEGPGTHGRYRALPGGRALPPHEGAQGPEEPLRRDVGDGAHGDDLGGTQGRGRTRRRLSSPTGQWAYPARSSGWRSRALGPSSLKSRRSPRPRPSVWPSA